MTDDGFLDDGTGFFLPAGRQVAGGAAAGLAGAAVNPAAGPVISGLAGNMAVKFVVHRRSARVNSFIQDQSDR